MGTFATQTTDRVWLWLMGMGMVNGPEQGINFKRTFPIKDLEWSRIDMGHGCKGLVEYLAIRN